jgi:hypothetical protein
MNQHCIYLYNIFMQHAEMNKASYISSTDILEVSEKFLKVLKEL